MNASLVRERAVAGDRVHEGHIDLNSFGDQVLDLTEHGKVILGLDVFRVGCVEAGDETAEGSDADALADAEDGGVDMRCSCFKCSVGVCNS